LIKKNNQLFSGQSHIFEDTFALKLHFLEDKSL